MDRIIENVISFHLRKESELLAQRKHNFEYASKKMSSLGFSERFLKNKKIVPSVLLLNNHGFLKATKEIQTHGKMIHKAISL